MSQSQNVIYYTTAQVTDMVELSDQNVRKYVRLLEDRKYEVAKDEHNRRLFSKKDVSVLQEMIKIAKSPGNTLDSAADEIIENMDDFEETPSENQVSKMSDSDVSRLLALVLEKLDEIQNENKELKSNISTLVHRLEEYDLKALEYNPVEKVETSLAEETYESEEVPEAEENETVETGQTEEISAEDTPAAANMEETITPETTEEEITVEAPADDTAEEAEVTPAETIMEETITPETTEEEITVEAPDEETAEEAEELQEETKEQNSTTIDLSTQEEKTVELNNDDVAKQQIEEPKKGFFGKLASMFKG